MATRTQSSTTAPSAPTTPEPFALISNAKLLQLYATMLQCRLLQEHAQSINRRIVNGHEASAVGVALDLLPRDSIVHAPEDIAPSLAKGVQLRRILRNLTIANKNGSAPEQIQRAIDLTQSSKQKKIKEIVAVFLSIDSTSLPACKPALQLAGKLDMPILFVCRNSNPSDDMAARVSTFGFPGIPVDSGDVVALYRVASEAIAHARKGHGATWIECKSLSVPNATNGSSRKKPKSTAAADPILNMEGYLERKGLFNPQHKQTVISEFNSMLASALRPATASGKL